MGGLPANKTVNGFAVDPSNPKLMYVAMRDGLFKSTDAGESWRPLGKELKNSAAVAMSPKEPNEIYAASTEGKILASADGGLKWKARK